MVKPEKLLFDNPNLMAALSEQRDTGSLRESFFASMVSQAHALGCPAQGDFGVDRAFVFEVGGKGKGFAQIRDLPGSYVAADGIESGYGNRIPLWMFGMLY